MSARVEKLRHDPTAARFLIASDGLAHCVGTMEEIKLLVDAVDYCVESADIVRLLTRLVRERAEDAQGKLAAVESVPDAP